MNNLQKATDQSETEINSNMVINCAFHRDKLITNFCTNSNCLLPMCPVCVAIHSEQHREENTHGEFQSIQEVIQNVSLMLLKVNKSLQDLSQQYTEDYWNKQKILQSCKQTITNQKKKLIKQIQRKFQQIEHKITRKITQFQDTLHDQYKQLESQIQYLYDSVNKQRQEFIANNDKILKNIIHFYGQKKQEKMKEWQIKFRNQVNELKKQSIRVKFNQEMFDFVRTLDIFFEVEKFVDEDNEYLITTGRQLIASNTKRKKAESPSWTDDKENIFSVRTNAQNQKLDEKQNKNGIYSFKNDIHWSASKF